MPHPSADAVLWLDRKRAALEGASDFWTLALEIATVAVVVGVIVEVVATALEVRDEIRHGGKVRVHNLLTLVGAAVVVLAVAGEFWAERQGASIETELRTNNSLEQAILADSSMTAIADIALTTASVEDLNKYLKTQKAHADRDMKELGREEKAVQATTAILKARAAALQADIDKNEKDLQAGLQAANRLMDTVAKRTRPRRMLSCDSWEPLKTKPQIPIEILYFRGAADAQLLSAEISLCLSGMGLRPATERPISVKNPDLIEDSVELAGGNFNGAGITVAVNPKGRETSHFAEGTTEDAVTKALSDVFGDAVTTNLWNGVPEGTIRIVIGPKA